MAFLPSHDTAPWFCSFTGQPEKRVAAAWWPQAVTTVVAMTASSWHGSLHSAVLSAGFLVGAWRGREPSSAVLCSCDARDALRSAFRSGQALQALANPLQESSCGLFRRRSWNWLIRAGGPVWRRCRMCALGEGRLPPRGSDRAAASAVPSRASSACSPESFSSKSSAVLGHFPCSF